MTTTTVHLYRVLRSPGGRPTWVAFTPTEVWHGATRREVVRKVLAAKAKPGPVTLTRYAGVARPAEVAAHMADVRLKGGAAWHS